MRLLNKQSGLAIATIALSISLQSAHATLITDNYIGGNDHGRGDVIGHASDFDIQSMDVIRTGNMLSVSINTNFAGKGDNHLFDSLTSGKGIGYGDLFLSSAWTPFGAAPYTTDNNSNGTLWSYGFSLDDRWMAEGAGSGTLYSLNSGINNNDALLSDDFLTGGIFRNGQETAVDITKGNITGITGSSNWSVNSSSINFMIDLTGTTLASSNTVALHWGMTCGNDTIEGEYSVPEPATLTLLIAGLAGFSIASKKRRKS